MRHFVLLCILLSLTACQPATTNPASSTPMLTVREATNCRTGPGTNYDIVFTYAPGTKLEITGRDESRNFWLVKSDKSPTGTCWLWTGSVDVTGNALGVASVAPPVTPTGIPSINGLPEKLFVEKWDYTCKRGTLTFTMNWKDQAAEETGYRIFRNGEQLVELPANSTSYVDSFNVSAGERVEYTLQVFNPGGVVNSAVMKAEC